MSLISARIHHPSLHGHSMEAIATHGLHASSTATPTDALQHHNISSAPAQQDCGHAFDSLG